MTQWVARELGPDVPLHFTAFHPDYRMLETRPRRRRHCKRRAPSPSRMGFSTSMSATSTIRRDRRRSARVRRARDRARRLYDHGYALDASGACKLRDQDGGCFRDEARRVGRAAAIHRHRALRGVRLLERKNVQPLGEPPRGRRSGRRSLVDEGRGPLGLVEEEKR